MSIILAIGLGLAMLCLFLLAIQLAWMSGAPRGWQDEEGFHLGEEPGDMPAASPPAERLRRTRRNNSHRA